MSETNIDKFNEVTGKIFAILYCSFPVPVDIHLRDFIDGEVYEANDETLTGYDISESALFVDSTINWLAEADFIQIGDKGLESHYSVVLTPKGLECLKLTPESLSVPGESLISNALKSGSKEALKILANQVLSAGIKIAAQKMGMP
ncbi:MULTISPECIES: hypothetical protein [Citrobacter]|uniref:hypothetical protein n=1 Tax=Citrobacter TaxID=544 RepID=UPI0019253B7C|nr:MULTISPECIES: hypothetical protein [Citrobacter]MDM3091574.1 hypothetical protein [Citrobacter sp. Cf136]MDT7420176.1 hypothetical protein [Citrobacter freundii]WGA94061.1 hypothetical protein NFL15_03235 [Citrobacter freundii]CAD5352312.1 conserved protein of unknown function [Citrobacter freundii]